jgi:hypothetical protein
LLFALFVSSFFAAYGGGGLLRFARNDGRDYFVLIIIAFAWAVRPSAFAIFIISSLAFSSEACV